MVGVEEGHSMQNKACPKAQRGETDKTRVLRSRPFLLNAILAKCENVALYFVDSAVNEMSLTGTQPDKYSQLQRRNQHVINMNKEYV